MPYLVWPAGMISLVDTETEPLRVIKRSTIPWNDGERAMQKQKEGASVFFESQFVLCVCVPCFHSLSIVFPVLPQTTGVALLPRHHHLDLLEACCIFVYVCVRVHVCVCVISREGKKLGG